MMLAECGADPLVLPWEPRKSAGWEVTVGAAPSRESLCYAFGRTSGGSLGAQ